MPLEGASLIRILHVDDSETDLELTKYQLLRLDKSLEIVWAESAMEALELVEREDFDCVLSDYQMPRMDGLGLLTEFKRRNISLPFIFLTGQGNEDIATNALRAGADDYFTKEIGFAHYDRLLNSITRVVEAHEQQERKALAEMALEESERKYRNLVERASDIIVIIQDQKYHFVNTRIEKLLGYTAEEINGQPFDFLIHPDALEMSRTRYHRRMQGEDEPNVYESALRHKDGTKVHVELNASVIEYEGKPANLVYVRDISDRKRSQQRLESLQALLEAAVEQSPAGIVIADGPNVNIRLANPAAMRIRGETSKPLTGIPMDKHTEHWQIFKPDGTPFTPDELPLSRALREGKSFTNVEAIIRRFDGEERWILINAAPVRNSQGEIIAAVGVFPDVTEQWLTERSNQFVHKLAIELASIDTLDGALVLCLDTVLSISNMDCGGIYLVDRNTGDMELRHSKGLSSTFLQAVDRYSSDSTRAKLAAQGRPIYASFDDMPELGDDECEQLRAVAVLPVLHKDKIIACINIGSHRNEDIPIPIRKALETVTAQIGAALAHISAIEELRENERQLSTLFDAVSVMIIVFDLEGTIIRANETALRRLGYTLDQLIGRDFCSLHPPEVVEKARETFTGIMKGEENTCHLPLQASDGTHIKIEARIARSKWGEQPVLMCMSREPRDRP